MLDCGVAVTVAVRVAFRPLAPTMTALKEIAPGPRPTYARSQGEA